MLTDTHEATVSKESRRKCVEKDWGNVPKFDEKQIYRSENINEFQADKNSDRHCVPIVKKKITDKLLKTVEGKNPQSSL